ncbi:MAG: type II toxin-antitoxin system RatA family toxin [Uliginosibacterium sp.]|jgi:ribosome-associated toxin RatA of RatAB toxin-antitoxin module|nr:type II toxin-antitoxin system RatA family toxin [Uliginosibacterium sp.]MBK9614906.1 type II toxin-antitoxin system RatA family toxin [Uliginosibacterium sp.]
MADVRKVILVECSASELFDLVDDVETYPEFLPWCGGTEVLERTEDRTVATLHIHYHGVKAHFTTRNDKQRPTAMQMHLRDGPFKKLEGHWDFKPLGETGCKVEFYLHYEFSNRLLEKIVGPVFSHIATTFVDAFVKRAGQLKSSGK